MEKRWLYVTCEGLDQLCDAVGGVCVVPMGAIEKHGLHLPLGADMLQAHHVVHLAAEVDPIDCNERIGKAAARFEAQRLANAFKVLKEDNDLLNWLEKRQENWNV